MIGFKSLLKKQSKTKKDKSIVQNGEQKTPLGVISLWCWMITSSAYQEEFPFISWAQPSLP